MREQQRARAATRGCECGFGAGVTAAHDNHVITGHGLSLVSNCNVRLAVFGDAIVNSRLQFASRMVAKRYRARAART